MPQMDVERALRALDGNMELLSELASMFIEDAPVLLEQLKTALTENHPKQVRSVVHSLKGIIATFFAKDGVEIAQRLEDSAASGDLTPFFRGELDRLEIFLRELTAEFEELGWVNRI